jgi:hypothetical protein
MMTRQEEFNINQKVDQFFIKKIMHNPPYNLRS